MFNRKRTGRFTDPLLEELAEKRRRRRGQEPLAPASRAATWSGSGELHEDALPVAPGTNETLLQGCPGPHKFEKVEDRLGCARYSASDQYRCACCGGVVRLSEKQWYERGLDHGLEHGRVERTQVG